MECLIVEVTEMNLTPKVAVIHDMTGFGRCSLTVVLPVLAAMGNQCCPMMTAYLSTHTSFPPSDQAVFLDMTEQMSGVAAHWSELDMSFDAIYSGFLGSAAQIGILRSFLSRFRRGDTLVMVDPVMGDHGRAYRTYSAEMCRRMGELAAEADVITPNLTEAAILLGEDYANRPTHESGVRNWLDRLSLSGRRSVVLTGISFQAGQVGAACLDRETGRSGFAMAREEPAQFPGTGDLFSSVLLGGLLRNDSLADATGQAVEFVQRCAQRTLAVNAPILEGVQFEPLLGDLAQIDSSPSEQGGD